MTIDANLRQQFPFAKFHELGRTGAVDILVAGCGTGQQLFDVAPRIVGARVLAIDLSRTSLAYAKRQTEALGLRNIEYGQADILRLGALGRSFDVIDCGGVLHHLGDPIAGWRVLLSLLRPDGVMRVALYSDMARQHFVAARALIAEHGYGHSADEIRRFRQVVLDLPDGDQVKMVARSLDFFSISSCRDLVFHAQEHRFTLPQIQAFLAANELEFLGFEIDLQVLGQYAKHFPEDRARTDLTRWHAFEQANPSTFGAMYQFWVQKRAPA
jgi:SAM-dependent methyltransferase